MIDECTITDCKANILKINHRHNHGPDAALVGKIIKNCKVLLFHFKSVQYACNTKLIPQYDIVFVV